MPGHLARAASRRSAESPRSTERSGPKTLTARLVLLPEIMWSMRWLIGWPKLTLTPGIVATARRISASSTLLGPPGPQHHLHLRGVHPLDVLVLLRAARAPAGRDDLREGEQRLLDLAAEASPSLERRPERADERDGQAALVERRQERLRRGTAGARGRATKRRRARRRGRAPRRSRQKVSVRS